MFMRGKRGKFDEEDELLVREIRHEAKSFQCSLLKGIGIDTESQYYLVPPKAP
jgi:hypothetical protein